jgi:glycosyltransferase involved in cell wall biosynthesis
MDKLTVEEPLVSIVVPAFNAAAFLEEAIESVRAQDWRNWELIIVDDGSTDETAAIIARQDDSRVRALSQSNSGVSAARNAALDVATGDFVTFLDADDRLLAGSLACRVQYLVANPAVDIVNGGILVTEAGKLPRRYTPSTTIQPFLPPISALDEGVFFGPFYMLRRSRIGPQRFPEALSHCEDLCFFLALAARQGLVYGAVDDEVYEYRKHGTSAMSDLDGIDSGYQGLIRYARNLDVLAPRTLCALKWRIATIMAKTWLRRGRPLRAARSVLRIWRIKP